ncbi:hypothetical protein [Companilactobacillus tucceti]|nr:hypothetical protein [Companilactobacillus tucceti]
MSNKKNQEDLSSLLECKSIDHLLEQNNIDDVLLGNLIQKVEVLRDKSS